MRLKLSPEVIIYVSFGPGETECSIIIEDKEQKHVISMGREELARLAYTLNTVSHIDINKSTSGMFINEPRSGKPIPADFSASVLLPSIPFEHEYDKPKAEVEIYIPDAHVSLRDSENITNACGEFMEALGYELETEDEPIYHSFWKKLKFVFTKQASPEEIDKLFNTGKRALQLKQVELPTAEQTEKLANASAKMVEALDKFEEGIARLGAVLVLKKKVNGETRLIIQQLSQELIQILDEKPQLLKSLQTVYELVTGDIKANKGILDTPQEINVVQPDELA